MIGLGDFPGGFFNGTALDVSADGAVIVGRSSAEIATRAFRWTAAEGMVDLGTLPGGGFSSQARAISSDGLVIVGSAGSASGTQAFRWTAEEGMIGLGDLPGGVFASAAWDVSADGSVVVGESISANGVEAFRWTKDQGMVGLGDLPAGEFASRAFAVSGDGSIVVGSSCTGSGLLCLSIDPFIWDAQHGMRDLREVLIQCYGLDLEDWELTAAVGISADGLTILGGGSNSEGTTGWLARLPDCNTNGIPDCRFDCNANGHADSCDIAAAVSTDCNENGLPDECEPDCNANGQVDECDIASGRSQDCNLNAVPDDCEDDCNGNGQADDCDIASGLSEDCNTNAIPDDCEQSLGIEVTLQPADQQVSPGGVALFSVAAEGVLLEYQWRKNGQPLMDSPRVFSSDGTMLLILDVHASDAGQYDCLITDLFGCQAASDTATLTVLCPADLTGDDTVDAGDLGLLLGSWGPVSDNPADLNGDDVVDSTDLALLLGSWGTCSE